MKLLLCLLYYLLTKNYANSRKCYITDLANLKVGRTKTAECDPYYRKLRAMFLLYNITLPAPESGKYYCFTLDARSERKKFTIKGCAPGLGGCNEIEDNIRIIGQKLRNATWTSKCTACKGDLCNAGLSINTNKVFFVCAVVFTLLMSL